MRQWPDITDYRPLLVGTIGAAASATACGDAIDVSPFADIMAILTYSVVGGTGGAAGTASTGKLELRFQEGDAAADTGGSMTDITDGMIMGSFKVSCGTGMAPTNPVLYSTVCYERLNDSNRKRYVRPIVTMVGTAGIEFAYSVGVILGRPRDTLYITHPTTITTTNAEYSQAII